jgi:formate-dependent nitrite reductase membrane component NrfD
MTMQELTTTRANPLVDPGLHVWHGEVAGYLFLGGLVAGLMILAGLALRLRPDSPRSRAASLLPWAAPILLSIGMFFLWLDLENPFNAFRFYLAFRPASPMSWGSWILLAIYPASLLLAWASTPVDLRRRTRAAIETRSPRVGRAMVHLEGWIDARRSGIATANVLLGVGLGVYTGLLLGTMAARPMWNSAILGPLFLTSGLSTGAAFALLMRVDDGERRLLGRVDMGLISIELALLAVWIMGLATAGAAGQEALATILGGPYTAAFWTLVVALGLVTPLVAEALEARHGLPTGRLAAALVLLGGFALRWILVYAGQHVELVGHMALNG